MSGPNELVQLSGGFICCALPFLLLSLGSLVFWVYTLVDCLTHEPSEGNDKVIWALVIVLTGLIGSILYYFIRRPQRIRMFGK